MIFWDLRQQFKILVNFEKFFYNLCPYLSKYDFKKNPKHLKKLQLKQWNPLFKKTQDSLEKHGP